MFLMIVILTGLLAICYHTLLPYYLLNAKSCNVLLLYKKLHTFGIKPSPFCSFCNLGIETPFPIFYECDWVSCLWLNLVQCFHPAMDLNDFNCYYLNPLLEKLANEQKTVFFLVTLVLTY